MSKRREFFKQLGILSGSGLSAPLILADLDERMQDASRLAGLDHASTSTDESYWKVVRSGYRISDKQINLNNGGVCPHPLVVEEALHRFHQLSNAIPSYYMSRRLDLNREPLRKQLAHLADCSEEEIAIQRNATEAIESIIFGLPLNKGDEVILTRQDYPSMINAWKQREMRDKIKLVWLDFDFPIEDHQSIVDRYEEAITPKTKLLHVTHIINWMGQILPVKALSKLAHDNGAEILVDGAHSFAQMDFSLRDLDCDYFGASLHKWLGAPFGTGMLYVKQDKVNRIFPLFASPRPRSRNIRKFEHLGTRSLPIEHAITQAIYFHNKIGIQRKEARLRHLKNYWAENALNIKNVTIGTSLKSEYSCGIGLLKIGHINSAKVANRLLTDYGIHTVDIKWHNIDGIRITPNVYTLKNDMDQFLEAIRDIANT